MKLKALGGVTLGPCPGATYKCLLWKAFTEVVFMVVKGTGMESVQPALNRSPRDLLGVISLSFSSFNYKIK